MMVPFLLGPGVHLASRSCAGRRNKAQAPSAPLHLSADVGSIAQLGRPRPSPSALAESASIRLGPAPARSGRDGGVYCEDVDIAVPVDAEATP